MKALIHSTRLTGHLVIEDDYDHDHASDGLSRFGAYLAIRLPAVLEDDPDVIIDPVRWSSFVLATATAPVMSPGYLTWTGPIEDIQVGWDDGHLAVETILRTRPPVHLRGWRGWDLGSEGNHREPWYGDRTALTRMTLRARLTGHGLPVPPEDPGCRTELVLTAKATVRAVAAAIDHLLAPVIAELFRLRSGRGPYCAGVHPMTDRDSMVGSLSERLLAPDDVAAFLGVPVTTLYQWRYKGTGPRGLRVGRHLRYRQSEVDAWLRTLDDDDGQLRSA